MENGSLRCGREFIDWLDSRVLRMKELEAELALALTQAGDEDYYRLLLEKTKLLAALYADGEPLLADLHCLSVEEQEQAATGLFEFSEEAERALSLNSPFYMSALLYPEEHQPGEPNDLDNFFVWMQECLVQP